MELKNSYLSTDVYGTWYLSKFKACSFKSKQPKHLERIFKAENKSRKITFGKFTPSSCTMGTIYHIFWTWLSEIVIWTYLKSSLETPELIEWIFSQSHAKKQHSENPHVWSCFHWFICKRDCYDWGNKTNDVLSMDVNVLILLRVMLIEVSDIQFHCRLVDLKYVFLVILPTAKIMGTFLRNI